MIENAWQLDITEGNDWMDFFRHMPQGLDIKHAIVTVGRKRYEIKFDPNSRRDDHPYSLHAELFHKTKTKGEKVDGVYPLQQSHRSFCDAMMTIVKHAELYKIKTLDRDDFFDPSKMENTE